MKIQFSQLIIGDCLRYTVKKKEHWWNRWHYIYDGRYPRLFSEEELEKFFIGKKLNKEI